MISKIDRLIADKAGKYTDKEFFTSRLLKSRFQKMCAALTGRYGLRNSVRVNICYKPKSSLTTVTNNRRMEINAGHPSITRHETRKERYSLVCGMFGHELGHVLFTDFPEAIRLFEELLESHWLEGLPYPTEGTLKSYAGDIREYLQTDKKQRFRNKLHNIWNILEDSFVNDCMLRRYPGDIGRHLAYRLSTAYDSLPTNTQLIENEDHVWQSIERHLVSYSIYGRIKYGETPKTDLRVKAIFEILRIVDSAVIAPKTGDRIYAALNIMVHHWPIIKDYFKYCEENDIEPEEANNDSGSEAGSRDTGPEYRGGAEPALPSPMAGGRISVAEDAAEADKREALTTAEQIEKALLGLTDGKIDAEDAIHESDGRERSADEMPDDADMLSEGNDDGSIEWDDDYFGDGAANVETEINEMLDSMAIESLDSERTDELNELAQTMSLSDAHKNIDIVVKRIRDVDQGYIDSYNAIAPKLMKISKAMQKDVENVIKHFKRGLSQTGLVSGQRMDISRLHRPDKRIFSRKILPNENAPLAVTILVDESGSMSGHMHEVIASTVVVYDFCNGLDIPIAVYGHTESYKTRKTELRAYAEFDSYDDKDCYRLMDLKARDDNRDGAAIQFVINRLLGRPELVKLLLIISDGAPYAYGYSGESANEDIRRIIHNGQLQGVQVIAAGIGDARHSIQNIYADTFLDISALKSLPERMADMIKRYLPR